MKKIVLDTSAYSRLMRGENRVEQALNEADKVFLPAFVVAELLLGFKNGDREEENRSILAKFEAMPTVERLFSTDETIDIFSDIFSSLKKAGKPPHTSSNASSSLFDRSAHTAFSLAKRHQVQSGSPQPR